MSSGRRLMLLGLVAVQAFAADWPQYLGPNGDGSSPETIRTNWQETAPQVLWRKSIGPGWSSTSVAGGRVFTQVRRTSSQTGEREFCVALDANTGNEIWARDVDSAIYTDLSGYSDQIDGPRSTPNVEGDRVYVLTSYLVLYCLRADTGAVIWRRDFMQEFGSSIIPWENAASPLIVGDLIFLNSNSPGKALVAVRKSDGGTVWSGQNDGLTHATPIYARIADIPQVIFLTRAGLVGVRPENGNVLWRLGFSPSSTSTAASPMVAGDYVHASAAYASGTWVARVNWDGNAFTATQAARQQGVNYQLHWATPVHHDGFLYCIPSPSSGQARLTCFDPAGGTNRWSRQTVGTGPIGYGSIVKAANALVVLTENGELVLVQPNAAGYTEIDKFKVLTAYCWNQVAISNGRIYARNSALASEIVALDVSVAAVGIPTFNLDAELTPDGARIKVTLRPTEGSVFDTSHLTKVELLSASNVAPEAGWTPLAQSFTLVDGTLVTEVTLGAESERYLRTREKN